MPALEPPTSRFHLSQSSPAFASLPGRYRSASPPSPSFSQAHSTNLIKYDYGLSRRDRRLDMAVSASSSATAIAESPELRSTSSRMPKIHNARDLGLSFDLDDSVEMEPPPQFESAAAQEAWERENGVNGLGLEYGGSTLVASSELHRPSAGAHRLAGSGSLHKAASSSSFSARTTRDPRTPGHTYSLSSARIADGSGDQRDRDRDRPAFLDNHGDSPPSRALSHIKRALGGGASSSTRAAVLHETPASRIMHRSVSDGSSGSAPGSGPSSNSSTERKSRTDALARRRLERGTGSWSSERRTAKETFGDEAKFVGEAGLAGEVDDDDKEGDRPPRFRSHSPRPNSAILEEPSESEAEAYACADTDTDADGDHSPSSLPRDSGFAHHHAPHNAALVTPQLSSRHLSSRSIAHGTNSGIHYGGPVGSAVTQRTLRASTTASLGASSGAPGQAPQPPLTGGKRLLTRGHLFSHGVGGGARRARRWTDADFEDDGGDDVEGDADDHAPSHHSRDRGSPASGSGSGSPGLARGPTPDLLSASAAVSSSVAVATMTATATATERRKRSASPEENRDLDAPAAARQGQVSLEVERAKAQAQEALDMLNKENYRPNERVSNEKPPGVAAPVSRMEQERPRVHARVAPPPPVAAKRSPLGEMQQQPAAAQQKQQLQRQQEAAALATQLGMQSKSAKPPQKEIRLVDFKHYKFQRKRLAGTGGSSKVYQVFGPVGTPDPRDDLQPGIWALKLVLLERMEPESESGFVAEAQLLKRLADVEGHEQFVIRLYDFEHRPGKFLKMLLEWGGRDLSKVLKEHAGAPLKPEWIKEKWRQMLQAVKFIHSQGVIHSDLKPANFLVVDKKVKLIDFGIAQVIPKDTVHISREALIGTPNYMAPEALVAKRKEDRRVFKCGEPSDVWSLGCILYQMRYGRTPFAMLQGSKKQQAIVNPHHAIEFPREFAFEGDAVGEGGESEKFTVVVEDEMLDVMKRCLERDPSKRATVDELLEDHWLRAPTPPAEEVDVDADFEVGVNRNLLHRIIATARMETQQDNAQLTERLWDVLVRQEQEKRKAKATAEMRGRPATGVQ